ncbi:hypothetical protein ACIBP6_42800 [Nonomuraea terrae]|uniref:hypothetical protein n=1 Tax=Nonomuraea terrae TaxID=2530383 RepID=UPI0037AF3F7D
MRWSDASTITLLAGQPDLPDAWWRSLPMPRVLAAIGPESLGELLTEIALEHWPAAALGDVLPALYVLDPEEADEPAVAIALDRAGSWAGLLALTGRELVDQPFIQARPVMNILFTAVLARLAPERPGMGAESYAAGGLPIADDAYEEAAAGRAEDAFHEVAAGHPLVDEKPEPPVPVSKPGAPVEEPSVRFAAYAPAFRGSESADDSYSTEDEEPEDEQPAQDAVLERAPAADRAGEDAAEAAAAPDEPVALHAEAAEAAEAAEWLAPGEPADGSAAREAAGVHEEQEHADAAHAEPTPAEAHGEAHGEAADGEAEHAEPMHAEPMHAEGLPAEPEHAEAEDDEPEDAEAEDDEPDYAEAEHAQPAQAEPVHAEAEDAQPEQPVPAPMGKGAGDSGGQGLLELLEAAFAGLDDKTWAVAQNRVFTDEPSAVDQLAKLFAVPPADITATEYELRTRLDQWLASDEAAPFRAHLDELIKTVGPAPSKDQLTGAASWHGAEIRALEVPAWQFVLASLAAHARQPQVQHVPPQVQFPPPPGGPQSAFGPFPPPPPVVPPAGLPVEPPAGPPVFQAFTPVTPPEANGEPERPYQPLKDVSQTRRCFRQPDGRWWLRVDVTAEQLAGGECPLPTGFAAYLGLSPGETKTVRSAAGELTMTWHGRPVLVSVAQLLVDVGAKEGGHLFLTLSDEGVLRARHLPVAAQGAEKITKALRLVGYTAPGGTKEQAARVIATRIGMTGPVPLPDLLARLRERGDRDLLELLD